MRDDPITTGPIPDADIREHGMDMGGRGIRLCANPREDDAEFLLLAPGALTD